MDQRVEKRRDVERLKRDDVAADWDHLGLQLADRYRIDEPLARGSLCVVYRGQDTVLRRTICVKTVAPDQVERYREALRACASFTHPGVVAMYDAIEQDDWLFLIQEYVKARPFATYLRNGLPVERTLDLCGQIAQTLAYAHAHGISHGDLTPAAVLVDRQAVVRLNNFCLPPDDAYFRESAATLMESVDAEGALRASESAALRDVFGVGLLLWQALSEPGAADVATRERAPRVFRADVPGTLRALTQRCVDPQIADRIVEAEQLALALSTLRQELAEERVALAEETPPSLRAARDEVAREAAWSVRETLGNVRQWAGPGGNDSRSSSAPTDPLSIDGGAQGPYAQGQRAAVVAPRIGLPSRPSNAPAARGRRAAATATEPTWDDQAMRERDSAHLPERQERGGLSVALVLLLGVALFVAFFLIGFAGLGPHIFVK